MKKIILMLALLMTSAVFANQSNELLSPTQRNEVIRSIDDVCGDTWCEGDYNFKFIYFSCDKLAKSCDLSFHFIKSEEQSVETYSPVQVCHFQNITNFKQIKDSNYSLNDNFYEELTNCIDNRQNEVQF
ncbi:MAG: hypothetical protein H7281_18800 [Bacteriovorax sp.]|nr:hypothetical protein [Bacteriovorax sp.]